jgi:hypothetical protein
MGADRRALEAATQADVVREKQVCQRPPPSLRAPNRILRRYANERRTRDLEPSVRRFEPLVMYGITTEGVITDNGSAHLSRARDRLSRRGSRHLRTHA